MLLVEQRGIGRVSRALGCARLTISSALAGLKVQARTIARIRRGLDAAAVGLHEEERAP